MTHIHKFDQYNEGFIDYVREKGAKARDKFFSLFWKGPKLRHQYLDKLKEYDIEGRESEDRNQVQLFHKKRLIADIRRGYETERRDRVIWTTTFFCYESEIPKEKGKSYASVSPISGQSEQPYTYQVLRSGTPTSNASIAWVLKIWSLKTNSGIKKNRLYQASSGLKSGNMINPLPRRDFQITPPKRGNY